MAIEETTKRENIMEGLCRFLWENYEVRWCWSSSLGASGGILFLWDKTRGSLVFTFSGDGFLGVCLDWGLERDRERCYIVNIYSKHGLTSKRIMWQNLLMSKIGFGKGLWCMAGDFNSVDSHSDRIGSSTRGSDSSSNEMLEFSTFLRDLINLVDLPLQGRRFTWVRPTVAQ